MQKLEAGKVFEMMDFGSLSMVSFLLLLSPSFSPLTTVYGRGPTRVPPPPQGLRVCLMQTERPQKLSTVISTSEEVGGEAEAVTCFLFWGFLKCIYKCKKEKVIRDQRWLLEELRG